MGEPQIQQLCCCECPGLRSIAPVHKISLKLTSHAFPLARIHQGKEQQQKKKITGTKITQTCPQVSTVDDFPVWSSHTYSWFSPGKTSPYSKFPFALGHSHCRLATGLHLKSTPSSRQGILTACLQNKYSSKRPSHVLRSDTRLIKMSNFYATCSFANFRKLLTS